MSAPMEMTRQEAVARLWNLGLLTWKLTPVQKDLYSSFEHATHKTIVWSCSRRLGKSYALCCIAIEKCLKKTNTTVKFIAPTQKHVKNIIQPLLKEIFKDCPPDLRPTFRTAENIYRFTNGSEIQLAGTDAGHAEGLRGGSADLCIVDEAGFCDDLRYIVQSILIPTTLTTKGRIILSSTPPKLIDHEFVKYMEDAEANGHFVKKVIYDGLGGHITMDMIQEIIDEYGGEDGPEFRREFMCELIKDEELTVVPEFDELLQKEIVKEWTRPAYYDIYVGGDIGFKDLTVFLFGYYDFKAAKIIIEDEIVMNGRRMTTDVLAQGVKDKEKQLFIDPISNEVREPYLRVCDNNLIVINDFNEKHSLRFLATDKYDSSMALNNMKVLLRQHRVIINPRCKTLINHLKYASWAKNKQTFARSVDNGHYDAVDALKYFCRAVQQNKNPYPASEGHGSGDSWWKGLNPTPSNKPINPASEGFANMFKIKRSLGNRKK